MKKLLALVLSLLMVFTVIPAVLMSATAASVGDSVLFYFGVNSNSKYSSITDDEKLVVTETTLPKGALTTDYTYPYYNVSKPTADQYVLFITPVSVDSGVYSVKFYTRSASTRGLIDIQVNDTVVATDLNTVTNSATNWNPYTLSDVTLTTAGTFTVKVTAKDANQIWLGGIELTKTADYGSTTAPTTPEPTVDVDHIEVTTDDFYLPDANTLNSDGERIVCYKDSADNIVACSSLATKGEAYDAVTVSFKQLTGARMRINGVNGLRFISEVNTADLKNLESLSIEITDMGTVISPYDSTASVVLSAEGFYSQSSTASEIAGSIVSIKDHNLTRDFVARGYLKIKLPDSAETEVEITAVKDDTDDYKRSVYKVASMAYTDTETTYSDDQKAVIKGYLDSVVIIENGVIVVPDGYTSPYIYSGGKIYAETIDNTDSIKLAVIDNTKYYNTDTDSSLSDIVTNDELPKELTMETFTLKVTGYDGSKFNENAVLILPASYSETGDATRLIIDCHGFTGSSAKLQKAFEGDATFSAAGEYYQNLLYFAHQGYAVLEVDGGGSTFGPKSMGNVNAVNGNIAAYEYCINNFNIKEDVFVKGSSMGGLTSQNLVTSGKIPVLAYIGESPVTSLYRQAYCSGWDNDCIKFIARRYDFDFTKVGCASESDFTYTGQSKKVSEAEIELFTANFTDKVAGVNGIWKYCSSFYDYDNKAFKAGYEDFLTATDSTRVAEIYNGISIDFPIPVKIYHGTNDQSVSCTYSEYFVNAINRGTGKFAELVTYETNTHLCLGTLKTYTCSDGTSFSVMDSYDDMLKFFQNYDK